MGFSLWNIFVLLISDLASSMTRACSYLGDDAWELVATGSTQVMMEVWGENWSGTRILTAERQWQIQLLEAGEQACAFEGKKSQKDGIRPPFLLEPARGGAAAS